MGIKLLVGLGNPGEKYTATRHNAGFWWVDLLARQHNVAFKPEAKFFGEAAKLNNDVWLLKPSTFMNASGKAVAAIANYYKISPDEILVAHDELDLQPGTAKLKFGGGHGGHNGLRDIHAALGTADYWRLRLGIGHPGDKHEVVNYVLKTPAKQENDVLESSIHAASGVVSEILAGNMEGAMLKLHTK